MCCVQFVCVVYTVFDVCMSYLLHALKKGVQGLENNIDDEEEDDELCLGQVTVAHVDCRKEHNVSEAARCAKAH